MDRGSFTGRARRRKTSWRVLLADRAARALITLGGLGTIAAVSLVCVFLAWVVAPLFLPARVAPGGTVALEGGSAGPRPVLLRVDDYRVLGWTMAGDGSVALFRADNGRLLLRKDPPDGERPSCVAFLPGEGRFAFGYPDGRVRLGVLGFRTRFLEEGERPPSLAALEPGKPAEHDGGIVERTPGGEVRLQTLRMEFDDGFELGGAIARVDLTVRGGSPRLVAWTADGILKVREIERRTNLLTGKTTSIPSGGEVRVADAADRGPPRWLLLSGIGTTAYAAWEDGRVLRFDVRDPDAPVLAETADLLEGRPGAVGALGFLIGKTTLAVGDREGTVTTWFTVRPDGATTPDGAVLVRAASFPGPSSPVTALSASERSRLLAVGHADGTLRLLHVTSGQVVGEGRASGVPADAVAVTPKEDGMVAVGGGTLSLWSVDAPHPEVTAGAILGKVRYEGAERPEHVWQSSSGTDDFEPKYGLVPLVFGTLKATLYTMLFAVPLALLAAIYSSEFLRPETRARVKPTLELMASLPSVVLGFLAGIVFAPFLEAWVPATLAAFATVPAAALLGSLVWQALPRGTAARWEPRKLPILALVVVPLGIAAALPAGALAERLLFAGDVRSWLDGARGTGTGGWFLLLLPACAFAVALGQERLVDPWCGAPVRGDRQREARREFLRYGLAGVLAVGGALLLSWALSALGFDPRGSFLDTFVQRNALVVGLVMGFAVIPLIYTLSEDALNAVPEHLRAASLAVGATRWQTAIRVILPTAASGLFSACMIGLGRAVGETMIVLMAAGNTPVLEWNVFNGFRTLSANIAVELPEAVQDGTAYRMLFLAALALFAMTFVLNTAAEVVRQRFRKRAYEL